MTLMELKVGQIWQARAQDKRVKIVDIANDRARSVYWDDDNDCWVDSDTEYHHSVFAEADGTYTDNKDNNYDLMVLLYDPS